MIKSDKKVLINIFGLPGVGKSTLRNALVEHFGANNCGKIPGDHYLKSKPESVSFLDYFTQDIYDWELLREHLSSPLEKTISPPIFDFEKFVRISDSGYHKEFKISRLNFVDTCDPCPFADVRVLITLDTKERKKRVENRGREDYFWKTFVLENWKKIEASDRELEKICRKKANLVLDGLGSVEDNAKKAVSLIKIHFPNI